MLNNCFVLVCIPFFLSVECTWLLGGSEFCQSDAGNLVNLQVVYTNSCLRPLHRVVPLNWKCKCVQLCFSMGFLYRTPHIHVYIYIHVPE